MKSIVQSFGVFIFTALLFLKVSAPHSYCHDDSNETKDCTVCLISLENQQDDFDYAHSFEFVPESIPILFEHNITYKSVSVTSELSTSLFSRPPPITATILA
ncbi:MULTISPECIES: hypothetical protein [unclassified Croceitalea]|uniref:hypothetical protein n=1 Tax=unclassified Croceitalea TaxID=2632280 RepID=UPI0030D7B045